MTKRQRQIQILQAAVRLFAQKGFAATGIRELSTAVGLNSATLYHYTGTGGKEEILSTVMRSCLDELLSGGRASIAQSADPSIQLIHLVSSHVGLAALNPLTAKVTDQEIRALSPDNLASLVSLRDDYESLFSMVLERGVRTGSFSFEETGITRLALLEMCNGVAHWFHPDDRFSVQQVQQKFVIFACRLVGCMPPNEQFFATHSFMPPILLDVEPRE